MYYLCRTLINYCIVNTIQTKEKLFNFNLKIYNKSKYIE